MVEKNSLKTKYLNKSHEGLDMLFELLEKDKKFNGIFADKNNRLKSLLSFKKDFGLNHHEIAQLMTLSEKDIRKLSGNN